MILTIKHAQMCRYCIQGIRDYCKIHNIDYQTFIRQGIDTKDLDCNDNIIRKMIEVDSKLNKNKKEVE